MSSNLFANLPDTMPGEVIQTLLEDRNVRIERIVSRGHCSPPGFWYDQSEHEWVVVLAGAARLRIADEADPRELRAGDFVHIPARQRHRVEWTTPNEPTIWLAVFHGDLQPKSD